MEDRAYFQGCFFFFKWLGNGENNNGLCMFSEVAYIELRENRPWGKIWASEKQNHIPIIVPKFSSRWWHSDVKDSSAKSQIELQQHLIPHRKHTQDPTLVGWQLMENPREDHQCEILFSKGRGFCTQHFLSRFIPVAEYTALWRPISGHSSLEVSTEFSATSYCTNVGPRFSPPTLYLENIDKSFLKNA